MVLLRACRHRWLKPTYPLSQIFFLMKTQEWKDSYAYRNIGIRGSNAKSETGMKELSGNALHLVLTTMRLLCCAGVDGDVNQHHHPEVPWLHEQRSDRPDCLPHPHPTPTFPHDGIHTAHHRLPGFWMFYVSVRQCTIYLCHGKTA